MNEAQNTVKEWQEAEALRRFTLISPLLDGSLDEAAKIAKRKEIAEKEDLSVRTLYRYEKAFCEKQFGGLKPKNRDKRRSQKLPENFEELVQEAIQLRREVPGRSVDQIIMILEAEGRTAPGVLKRSTLERHLYHSGFGSRRFRMLQDSKQSSSRRFCKPNRMMLLQGDIKYGPSLPIGPNGAKVKTYLSSAIDDHSRYILASRFYATQEEAVVEDTFRTVITRYGKFDACYFDNGSQYIAKQLKFSLARLGIRILHAPIRSGKSKGKIEKFHQVVDRFLRESALKKPKTLDELNRLWEIYLEEAYQKAAHDGIAEYYRSQGTDVPPQGITPLQEFNRDSRPLIFIDTSVIAEAFLHHEVRRVDKGACISFQGRRYETKPALIGAEVEIAFDPVSPETIKVRRPGMEPFTAVPLKIGGYCSGHSDKKVQPDEVHPETSRLLDALEKKHAESRERVANAISFAAFRKEDGRHV